MENDRLINRLRQAFKLESEERLLSISNKLMEMEHAVKADRGPVLEVIFRDAHSLKGAARAVDFNAIETFFQAVEDVFGAMKSLPELFCQEISDVLHQGLAVVERKIEEPENDDLNRELEDLGNKISCLLSDLMIDKATPEIEPQPKIITKPQKVAAKKPELVPEKTIRRKPELKPAKSSDNKSDSMRPMPAHGGGSVRIARDKLDDLLYHAEELVALKQLFSSSTKSLQDLREELQTLRTTNFQLSGIINSVNRDLCFLAAQTDLQHLPVEDIDLASDILSMSRTHFSRFEHKVTEIIRKEDKNGHEIDKLVDDCLDNVRAIALQPFSVLADTYPRMMRDLSQETGHEINFEIKGGNLEIDRRILDQLNYPIIHLLRNAVDHGIETPDIREANGKTRCGNITLEANAIAGKKVQIIVEDDGGGIEIASIRREIIEKMSLSADEVNAMSEQQVLEHIFMSGFSTSSIITSISGRGLGMSIVREVVEDLGGSIKIENESGKGTKFTLDLPVSLSSLKGIFVEVGEATFVFPLIFVRYVTRIDDQETGLINGRPTWNYQERSVPVAELSSLLEVEPAATTEHDLRSLLVIKAGEVEAAVIVDRVIEEMDITVKPMGKLLKKVPNFSGIAVIGADELVPVLNVRDLLKTIMGGGGTILHSRNTGTRNTARILVAEDSITTRMLLVNILESAGYEVESAIDGQDALNKLRANEYHLLVSDIEMPLMNGFNLTENIRSDEKLADLPVILCTTLTKREDRQRGVQVGANAYLTKKNFEQSNLLETVARFI
jgi:two-component system, chemotaxis family, sensor kinase CheA